MGTFAVVGCASGTIEFRDGFQALLNEVYGNGGEVISAYPLAGPNEFIQLLLVKNQWLALALSLGLFVGGGVSGGFFGAAGEALYQQVSKQGPEAESSDAGWNDARIARLLAIVKAAQENNNNVLLGFEYEPSARADRHPAILLPDANPETLAKIAFALGANWDSVHDEINRHVTSHENHELALSSECIPELRLNEDGSISFTIYELGVENSRRDVKSSPSLAKPHE